MWNPFKKKPKTWYDVYKPSKWDQFCEWIEYTFQSCLCWVTEHKCFYWVDALIDSLCYLEMNIKLSLDPEFRDSLHCGDVCVEPRKSWIQTQIPENTLYCDDCPFRDHSTIARFFYGSQMSGYCYKLNRGDFTFGHATDILWDGCKCCGIGEDIEFEDEPDPDAQKHIQQIKDNYYKNYPEERPDEEDEIEDIGLQALEDYVDEMSRERMEDSLFEDFYEEED